MKKLFKISLVLLAVLFANAAQADNMELVVKVAKENSKWVSFVTNEPQELDLTLYSATGEMLYEQRLKTNSNKVRTYDLSALPEGDYKLKMESNDKQIVYQIQITTGSAILSQPVITEIKKPVFAKENNMVTLNLNGTCSGEVEIVIYNEHNEKVHDDVYSSTAATPRKFDVSKTMSKELTFIIRSAGSEYTETIRL